MSVASTRALRARRIAARVCVVCETPVTTHVRCDDCHGDHIAANRARKNRGIYQCGMCGTKGHNARVCVGAVAA